MKHKKIVAVAVGIAAVATGAFALASCGGESKTHEHSAQKVSAVAATCSEEGNSEYYYCSGCGKYFSDASCSSEITKASTVIAKADHSYVETTVEATCTEEGYTEKVCSVCGDKQVTDKVSATGHSYVETTVEATCTEEGYTEKVCSVCGDKQTETISAKGHSLTYVAEQTATCTTNGNIAYYVCKACGKLFSDEKGENEISADSIVTIGAHKLVKEQAKAATCQSEGNFEYYYCSVCGYHFSDPYGNNPVSRSWGKIEKTKHNYVNGVCTVCGDIDPDYIESKTESEGLDYTISKAETSYSVSGIGTCTDTVIIIPDKHNELPVIGIEDEAFKNNTTITAVVVPDTVTSIGKKAFAGCTSLTDVTVPDTATIGNGAFLDCNEELLLTTTHDLEYIEAKEATCSIPGNIAYWQCKNCGQYFSSESAETRLFTDEITVTVEHSFVDGICEICGIKNNAIFITSVDTISDLGIIPEGMFEEGLGLPLTVNATTADGSTVTLNVEWDAVDLYKLEPGTHTIVGHLDADKYLFSDGVASTVTVSFEISEAMAGTADIVFIIDTTGSMSSGISNVKTNIIAFANNLVDAGVSARYAYVDYKDISADKYPSKISSWYTDVSAFKTAIGNLSADGGGDRPESTVDALYAATTLDTRTSVKTYFILVTDADYHELNNYGISSMSEMIDILVEKGICTSVVTQRGYYSTYQDLVDETGGVMANIYSDFDSTLDVIKDKIQSGVAD